MHDLREDGSPRSDVDVIWAPQPGSQEAFLACPFFEVLYEGTRGPGKGLPENALVYTPNGPLPISDVCAGQEVCSPNGGSTTVTGVFPQGERPCYRLTFRDGREAVCDDQHKWTVKHGSGWATWSMERLLKAWRTPGRTQRYYIPTAQPLHYGHSDWAVDPYLLGLLLGDAAFRADGSISYCTVDAELADYVLAAGFREVAADKRNDVRYFTLSKHSELYRRITDLVPEGQAVTKRVPDTYLNSDVEARLAMLQGLMDTDGSASAKDSTYEFGSSSAQLALDVQHLARSLGAVARYTCDGARHRVLIQTGNKFQPTRLTRKQGSPYQHRSLSLRIESIEEIAPCKTICIKVDSEDGLFVTDQFVVTHNTDALLMDFAQFVGRGFGSAWKGVLFRQTYPQLSDVIDKTKKWFPQIWPGAKYNESEHFWRWPTGEQLLLRQFQRESDYWNYHGHAYPWIGWEELCNWPDDTGFKRMMSCCRSTQPGMPRHLRATTNPYGPGHTWVKHRYRLPGWRGVPITDAVDEEGVAEPTRIALHGSITENRILLDVDPDYITRLRAAARNEAERAAWLEGSWDIVAGGMFDDVWNSHVHVVDPFDIPYSWKIDRSFDWGESKPFSVGWWAESDGSDVQLRDGSWRSTVRGDLFRVAEWYGWTGKPNEGCRMLARDIAKGIREREKRWGWLDRVKPGPADTSIFNAENGNCIADDMAARIRLDSGETVKGVLWTEADKRPGSRKTGWSQLRQSFQNALPTERGPRENPGLYVFRNCDQFIRTMPVLPRDEKDMDDVDTDTEDHIADETRYRVRFIKGGTSTKAVVGSY